MKDINYNRTGDIIEVIIRDHSMTKLDKRRANLSDKEECKRLHKWLKEKYGYEPEVDYKKSPNWLDPSMDLFD